MGDFGKQVNSLFQVIPGGAGPEEIKMSLEKKLETELPAKEQDAPVLFFTPNTKRYN
jgi:hypothetical protein